MNVSSKRSPVLLLVMALLGSGSRATSQEAAEDGALHHTPPPCLDTDVFTLIEARADSVEQARRVGRATLRFKAESDADWYAIEFRPPDGAVFQAALPKPLPEAVRVSYYITWGDPERRTPEFTVPVLMGGCPGARVAPASLTDGIPVERTADGQDAIPAGFSDEGIHARGGWPFVTVGLVAAGGAGAGFAVAASNNESAAPAPPPVEPGAPRACFQPDPIPDIDSGDRIRFDASCTTPVSVTSYRWNFGDGTTASGSSVEHLFRPGGIYTVTLTVSDGARSDTRSGVVRVLATPLACFITAPDPPRIATNESINFNAECSLGDRDGGSTSITTYAWDFGDGRPGAEGVFVSRQFPEADTYGVSLTVTNEDGRQDTKTVFVVAEASSAARRLKAKGGVELRFTSHLEVPAGDAARAQVVLNGSGSDTTRSNTPHQHRFQARSGKNVLEARLISKASPGEGRWRFDFDASQTLVPGTLRVEAGQVLALEARAVVFRVTGDTAPVLRFTFELNPQE